MTLFLLSFLLSFNQESKRPRLTLWKKTVNRPSPIDSHEPSSVKVTSKQLDYKDPLAHFLPIDLIGLPATTPFKLLEQNN